MSSKPLPPFALGGSWSQDPGSAKYAEKRQPHQSTLVKLPKIEPPALVFSVQSDRIPGCGCTASVSPRHCRFGAVSWPFSRSTPGSVSLEHHGAGHRVHQDSLRWGHQAASSRVFIRTSATVSPLPPEWQDCYDMLWHVVTCCDMLWHVVTCCDMLWHVMTCCDMLWQELAVFRSGPFFPLVSSTFTSTWTCLTWWSDAV